MSDVGAVLIRGVRSLALNLLVQVAGLALFVLLLFASVGLGLPFAMSHFLLVGVTMILLAGAVFRAIRQRRSDG